VTPRNKPALRVEAVISRIDQKNRISVVDARHMCFAHYYIIRYFISARSERTQRGVANRNIALRCSAAHPLLASPPTYPKRVMARNCGEFIASNRG